MRGYRDFRARLISVSPGVTSAGAWRPRSARRRTRAISTRWPRLSTPRSIASRIASGIDADEVLPTRSRLTYTFSAGSPRRSPTAPMIRWLAWCGTKRSTCSIPTPAAVEDLLAHVGERAHRDLERLVAAHLDERQPCVDVLLDVRRVLAAAAGHLDEVGVRPVGVPGAAQDPLARRRGLEHHRAGTVAEEDAGGAVGVVGVAGERLGADHHCCRDLSRDDELAGDVQGVEEARAGGRDVEAGRVLDAERRLDDRRRGRDRLLRRWRWPGSAARPPPARRPRRPSPACPASIARVATLSSGPTTWRSRIPVRDMIHSSDVSTMRSKSLLVRTFSGRHVPRPAIRARDVVLVVHVTPPPSPAGPAAPRPSIRCGRLRRGLRTCGRSGGRSGSPWGSSGRAPPGTRPARPGAGRRRTRRSPPCA